MTLTINQAKLAEICAQHDVQFLGLFGSAARGEATAQSDVDILARFSKDKSLLELTRVQRALAEVFHRRVDLVTEGSVHPYLKDSIKSDLQVLYEQKG